MSEESESNLTVVDEDKKIHQVPTLSPQQEKEISTYLTGLGVALNETQMQQFVTLCREFQLNPFKREIYGVAYGDNFNIIVGYEVYIKRAERSQKLDGWERGTTGTGNEMKAWIKIYRKDWSKPFYHEVDYSEYVQTRWDYDRQEHVVNAMWASKPKTMLMKVVTAQAFRLAFPDEFAGMPYTSDEIPTEEGVKAGLPKSETTLPTKIETPPSNPSSPSGGINMAKPGPPTGLTGTSPFETKKANFWSMLTDMHGENAGAALEKLTTFKGRDGNMVPGKSTMERISQKQLGFMYPKLQKEHTEWTEKEGHVEVVPDADYTEAPGENEPPQMDAPLQTDDDLPF